MNPILASVAAVSIASFTQAQTFLITQGNTLYRYSNGVTQAMFLSNQITGLTTVPIGMSAGTMNGGAQAGDIFAVANGNGGNIAYRLNNPLGAASLTQVGVMGGGGNNSPVFANGSLYGVLLGVNFLQYNPTTLAAVSTTSTGIAGGSGGLVNLGGNNFQFCEALTDSMYAYTPGGVATLIGPMGVNFDNSGMEASNGIIYAALGRVDNGALALGMINPATGAFTVIANIDAYRGEPIGLAIINSPTPSSLSLLALAGVAAQRRRR